MQELSEGVKALIGRMETHPEEFYGDASRWKFMFKEHFRDCLTELEKGAIHNALREVRRSEFTVQVVATLMEEPKTASDEVDEYLRQEKYAEAQARAKANPIKPKYPWGAK